MMSTTVFLMLVNIYRITSTTQPYVELPIGMIYGLSTLESYEYLGIPYAHVSKRWTPPQDLFDIKFKNHIYNATKFGPCCAQLPTQYSYVNIPLPTSEQCQYLNIFTPPNVSSKSTLPTMVWIHGGGGNFGCSSQSIPIIYNGSNLIGNANSNRNVIIVTINYRLDILSSLYLPELASENISNWNTSGNYGTLDIISALKWIQANIEQFGGDPNRVTLFGESAGGNYGMDLAAFKPIANGLFHQVISESGDAWVSAGYSNISDAANYSHKIAADVGCINTGNDNKFLECLRNVNITQMMLAFEASSWVDNCVVDHVILLDYPQRLAETQRYMNVSLFMGNNYPDFMPTCIFLPNANSSFAVQYCNDNLPLWGIPIDMLNVIYEEYGLYNCTGVDKNINNPDLWCCTIVTQIFLDYVMTCSARRALTNVYKYLDQYRLYLYEFECSPYCPKGELPICQHTSEIAYVFGTVSDYESNDSNINCDWDDNTRTFSDRVIDIWTSFAYMDEFDKNGPAKFVPYNISTNKLGYSEYFYIGPNIDGFRNKRFNKDDKCNLYDQIENDQNKQKFGSNS
eukprot:346773_1